MFNESKPDILGQKNDYLVAMCWSLLSQTLSNVHCTICNEYHDSVGHTNEFCSQDDYKHVATVLVNKNPC